MLIFDNMDAAGFLPWMADEEREGTLREQLDRGYAHGGGWQSFAGFSLWSTTDENDKDDYREVTLCYPGDPPLRELARAKFRDQLCILFEGSWVTIIEADGSFEVSRMD